MNYMIDFDLLRIKGAQRKGKRKGKRYIVIPESDDVVIGQKGAYCKFVAQRHKKPHPRGYSHYIKPYVDYDEFSEMSMEDRHNIPFVGNMRRFISEKERD